MKYYSDCNERLTWQVRNISEVLKLGKYILEKI